MKLARSATAQALLTGLIVGYVRLITATLRWRRIDFAAAEAALESEAGIVGLFWHGRIAQALASRPFLRGRHARVLISQSRDGAFIARAATALGVPPIRGSTGREGEALAKGGAGAFREAVRHLAEGGIMLITPDGPRGPAQTLQMGPLQLARAARCETFALGLAARPALGLGSWDRARLPLPFARAVLVVSGPLPAPDALAEGQGEARRAAWQSALDAAQARADGALTPRPLGLALYALATALVAPALTPWLALRRAQGKEDPSRWREKLGIASRTRPPGPLIWLHGVSAGEGLSLIALAQRLSAARPGLNILVTTATTSSAALLAPRLPPGAIHQFAPLDSPAAVARFLDHWRPDAGVLAESELWPNLIWESRARGVRLGLISARLSAASAARWARAPRAARALLTAFDLILARDATAAHALERLGARVHGVADLKFGAPPLPADPAALAALRSALDGRPVLLGASTHPGEDELLIGAFKALAARPDAPLLVLAPRHVERGAAIAEMAAAEGLRVGRRAEGADPGRVQVYVADTVGELGLFYRMARLSVVGGSLIEGGPGGHNPLEPARLNAPFVTGPHVAAWPLYAELEAAGATRLIPAEEMAAVFAAALAAPKPDPTPDPDLAAMARRAAAFTAAR
ncbi:MAG: DUF374 domain-containing protein, partial [Alphaproteobacteria bacterium]|nr:DUF374 domain-containing protein [Alphaproteobacteria bacterium]